MGRWRKLGIIAGAGVLPLKVAQSAATQASSPFIVRLAGAADETFSGFAGVECGIAEVGRIIRSFKDAGCDAVTLAGVVKRPDFSRLKPDWRGAALLPRVIAAAAKGDGALLGVIVETLEAEGFLVIGAEEVFGDLVAPEGAMTVLAPSPDNWSDIRKAAAIIAALGPFDIGQAAVVASGHTLGVEAAEGTDAMLDRCAKLPASARGGEKRNGVLVKRPKPGQELRVDLPTVGVETVRRVDAAGLSGIAIEAGFALMVDREALIREADTRGVFVYGFKAEEAVTR
ncbi:MAG: UDP-2,3-diacylglucosamine diphosphatase LpxI [Parvularculaceae bacterium]|nr:UDP-2,3-diacylglucosamine diphosphatase LpxI [Parvularculaceae bacterium]